MIMIANQKILRILAFRIFRANKSRNLIAILAIALTTILFASLFTIGSGMVETFQNETMRQSGGSAHASLKYLTKEQYNQIKNHPLIEDIGLNIAVATADNAAFLKRHVEIWYSTSEAAKMDFDYPSTGDMPQKANEIVIDTASLDLLGVPHKIGQRVTLDYTIQGIKHSHTFVVSGFYESDPGGYPVGIVVVSRPFVDSELAGVVPNYRKTYDAVGTIRADIMFENSINIDKNIVRVINESGYSVRSSDPNYVDFGVNWAYMSTSFSSDPEMIVSMALIALLIILSGYLIIYNIFQISVAKDIRFYGLLKTIGTTPGQIKGLIIRQALLLSLIGIPLGLAVGYLLGIKLLPGIISISSFEPAQVVASPNPYIFCGAALFSLVTVFISCFKPGRTAGRVSPVEAVRYTGAEINYKRARKTSTDGGRVYKMARSNLGRNKTRTAILVISMSLSLILLNSIYTISQGFDMDKYLAKFVQTDFVLAHANYFNVVKLFNSADDALSPRYIDAVKPLKGFAGGGKLYYNVTKSAILYKGKENYLQLYGLDDFPLQQLDIVEGKLDMAKLKSGRYIIEGLGENDYGQIYWDQSHFSIGDEVLISTENGSHKYIVMAKCRVRYSNCVRWGSGGKFGNFSFYLPAGEFCTIIPQPVIMSYQCNFDDSHIADAEAFLKGYTKNAEPVMDYESKATYEGEFKKLQNILLLIGGILSLIIGFIGILNFINSMLTSIIVRRQEFAMLQSIGLTDRQLCGMLICEGLYYALATMITSMILGIVISYAVINGMVSKLWFFSYHFTVTPLLISYPILIILLVAIPFAAFHGANRQSIVERLRESEY